MAASSPTLIDALKARKIFWSALSGVEASLAIRICFEYCDGKFGKMAQMLSAYIYIASKRDNAKMTASVTDSEVAANVPRIRRAKKGAADQRFVGADAYRKGAKNDLRACGLVDFESSDPKRAGQLLTVYTFPALAKELSLNVRQNGEDAAVSGGFAASANSGSAGTTPALVPGSSEQIPRITPTASEHLQGFTPTSIDTKVTGNMGSIEDRNSPNSDFILKWSGVRCPDCGSADICQDDPIYWTCNACGWRFDADGYVW